LVWSEGQKLRTEYRRSVGDTNQLRKNAEELVALTPDAILVTSSAPLATLRQATRTVPIVFVQVADPVEEGAWSPASHGQAAMPRDLRRLNMARARNG
jgi:putative tryptophan/tyrosine transport system substrate-binding protein